MSSMMGSQQLLGSTPLALTKRPKTDVVAGRAFGLLALAAVGFSVYGASRQNFSALQDGYDSHCAAAPPGPPPGPLRRLHAAAAESDISLIAHHAYLLVGVAGALLLLGLTWIHLLKTCAKPIVYATVIMIPFAFLAGGVATRSGSASGGDPEADASYALFALAALCSLWILCCRRALALTAALLEQAAIVLSTHPTLLLASLGLLIACLVVWALGLSGIVLLIATGHWQAPGGCEWVVSNGAYAGICVVGFFLLWASMFVFALRFHTTSLTTALWYWGTATASTDSAGAALIPDAARASPVSFSLKVGLGSSYGTLCFSSLVLTVCEMLNSMARQAQRDSRNLAACLIACCLQCILRLIEFVTKFALAFHSVTGAPFCESARQISSTFSRHAFRAYFVDRMSSLVLGLGALAMSSCAAAVVAFSLHLFLPSSADVVVISTFTGLTFILGLIILNFCGSVLLNVVDAAYTCLALDMDHGARCQPAMRDAIFVIAKPAALAIEQPGGAPTAIAVAAPGQPVAVAQPVAQYQQAGPRYPPPVA